MRFILSKLKHKTPLMRGLINSKNDLECKPRMDNLRKL